MQELLRLLILTLSRYLAETTHKIKIVVIFLMLVQRVLPVLSLKMGEQLVLIALVEILGL